MQFKNKRLINKSIISIGFFICFFLIGFLITSASIINENPILVLNSKKHDINPNITVDYTPPYWNPPLSNQIRIFGNNFSYQITARDTESPIDSIWLGDTKDFQINILDRNDTEHWAIAEISNKTALSLGVYWLTIYVNDTSIHSPTKDRTIKVTVKTEDMIFLENLITASQLSSSAQDEEINIPGYEVYILMIITGASIASIILRKKHFLKL